MSIHFKLNQRMLRDITASLSKQINQTVRILAKNKTKVIAGAIGGGILADDLHTRYKSKQLKKEVDKRNIHTTKVLVKQNAEIKNLESQAEKVPELENVNEQLRKALAEQGGTRHE